MGVRWVGGCEVGGCEVGGCGCVLCTLQSPHSAKCLLHCSGVNRQASVLRSTLDGPPIVHLLSTPPTRQHLSSTQQHMGPVEVNVGDIIDVV